jgi:predicted nucleotidyltransferase
MSGDMPMLSIPPGTQVVIRRAVRATHGAAEYPAGAVGIVAAGPSDAEPHYRVRFPDGGEAVLRRDELSIRKQHQRDRLTIGAQPASEDLRPYIIYVCVVGSRAYGLDSAASDTDRRGIYLPPARLHWSLAGVPEQIEDRQHEECYWELQKFLLLALKANPNVLECLYTPLVEHTTPLIDELRGMREIFLSKLIYQTYNGYVLSQFRRMEQDLRTSGAIKQKHAMHLIRLLLSGITALREGTIAVDVGAYRERLLAIRRGELPWEALNEWRLALHREFDAAYSASHLPERPDYARADAFLIAARRSMVDV